MSQVDPNRLCSPSSNRYVEEDIAWYFSPNGLTHGMLRVEKAHAVALGQRGYYSQAVINEICAACDKVTAEEAFAAEQRLRHDIRGLLACITEHLHSEEAKQWLHYGATSMDLKQTAEMWLWKRAFTEVVLPELDRLIGQLIVLALGEVETVQIGRTHLQHAVPITFGFAVTEYIERLGDCRVNLANRVADLRSKFRGATGSANALSLLMSDPLAYEKEVLALLGLQPARYSTQIVPVEPRNRVMSEVAQTAMVLGNWANDWRHLMMTELNEITLSSQGGSSAMPHKVNPTDLEKACSLARTLPGAMVNVWANASSDFQRDLCDSASSRTYGEYVSYLMTMIRTMGKVMKKLTVNRERMRQNLGLTKGMVLAEAYKTLLPQYGITNADELMREVAATARETGQTLHEVALADPRVKEAIQRMTDEHRAVCSDPANYIGQSIRLTTQVAHFWASQLDINPKTGQPFD